MRLTKKHLEDTIDRKDAHIQILRTQLEMLTKELEILKRQSPEAQRTSLIMGAMSLNHTARDLVDAALRIARMK